MVPSHLSFLVNGIVRTTLPTGPMSRYVLMLGGPRLLRRFEIHRDRLHDPISLGQNFQDALIVLHVLARLARGCEIGQIMEHL